MRGRAIMRYHSLLLANHQVIWAYGCPCESFYPGEYLLRTLPDDLRQELFAPLPLLKLGAAICYGPTVRPGETVQQAKQTVKSASVSARRPQLQPCLASAS
jgi:hypothetical protein